MRGVVRRGVGVSVDVLVLLGPVLRLDIWVRLRRWGFDKMRPTLSWPHVYVRRDVEKRLGGAHRRVVALSALLHHPNWLVQWVNRTGLSNRVRNGPIRALWVEVAVRVVGTEIDDVVVGVR